jgi:hypothetical protein
LDWVTGALAKKTKRITARDQAEEVSSDETLEAVKATRTDGGTGIDKQAFLKP